MKRLSLILCLIPLSLAACGTSVGGERTHPALVRTSGSPLFQNIPSAYTVTVTGWAVDVTTEERIDKAVFFVVTIVGSYTFTDTFQVSFPADTVLQILARAEGYADKPVQIKPHYERNVQLEMKVEMLRSTPTPG